MEKPELQMYMFVAEEIDGTQNQFILFDESEESARKIVESIMDLHFEEVPEIYSRTIKESLKLEAAMKVEKGNMHCINSKKTNYYLHVYPQAEGEE